MTNKREQNAIRKALLQERMAAQRLLLKPKLTDILKTSTRLSHLFNPAHLPDEQRGSNKVVTVVALLLAALGKKRAGWLGAGARYLIINYPGLLRKFTKK